MSEIWHNAFILSEVRNTHTNVPISEPVVGRHRAGALG